MSGRGVGYVGVGGGGGGMERWGKGKVPLVEGMVRVARSRVERRGRGKDIRGKGWMGLVDGRR